jgi:hypothetical protein
LIKENYEEFQLLMTISTIKGIKLLVKFKAGESLYLCKSDDGSQNFPPHLEKKAHFHLPSLPRDKLNTGNK